MQRKSIFVVAALILIASSGLVAAQPDYTDGFKILLVWLKGWIGPINATYVTADQAAFNNTYIKNLSVTNLTVNNVVEINSTGNITAPWFNGNWNGSTNGVVRLLHPNGTSTYFQGTDDTTRGTALFTAVNTAQAYDTIYIGSGVFALGNNVLNVPDYVSMFGSGIETTNITSTNSSNQVLKAGAIVRPGSYATLGYLTIQHTQTTALYQYPLGFVTKVGQQPVVNAIITSVHVIGQTDGIFLDNTKAGTTHYSMKVFDSLLESQWDTVAENSIWPSDNIQNTVEIYNTHINTICPNAFSNGVSSITALGNSKINIYGGDLYYNCSASQKAITASTGANITVNLYGTRVYSEPSTTPIGISCVFSPCPIVTWSHVDSSAPNASISGGGSFTFSDTPEIVASLNSANYTAITSIFNFSNSTNIFYGNGQYLTNINTANASYDIVNTTNWINPKNVNTTQVVTLKNISAGGDILFNNKIWLQGGQWAWEDIATSNMALGFLALGATPSGNSNLAFGDNAGLLISSGSRNSAFGTSACQTVTTGSDDICFGYSADMGSSGVTGSMAFGRASKAWYNNQLVFGGPSGSSSAIVDVFIGKGYNASGYNNVTIQPTVMTGTNVKGNNITIAGGRGTGTGTSGLIKFATSNPTASGSATHTLTDVAWMDNSNFNVSLNMTLKGNLTMNNGWTIQNATGNLTFWNSTARTMCIDWSTGTLWVEGCSRKV